jgi:hemolysin activation/secretion protein
VNVLKFRLAALVLLTSSFELGAAEAPSAGSQIQQVPAAPAPERVTPALPAAASSVPGAAPRDEAAFEVSGLRIVGARRFTAEALIAATGFEPGRALTLETLRGYARVITEHYRSAGYFLAQATVPAQDIVSGVVTITVMEGTYGAVVLRNQSSLADGLAAGVLHGLHAGDPIVIGPLESRLLLLSDLPGVSVRSTLVRGASVGASDLVVEVLPDAGLTGSLDVDNAGSRYTGKFRSGGTVNLNNPLGRGDVATLRMFTSWQGLDYGRAAYQQKIGPADAGIAYTALSYDLGGEFASLEAHGRARISSAFARYPLQRSRRSSIYVLASYDAKSFRDTVDVTTVPTVTRKRSDTAMLSLAGDYRDQLGGGGSGRYSLTWSSGRLDIRTPAAQTADALSSRSDGHYDKLGATFVRLQRLTSSLSVYASLQGQLASRNLDPSEKLALGGDGGVRAYAEGDAYVDEGHLATLELRHDIAVGLRAWPGQLQLAGFVDRASGKLSREVWSAQPNGRTLAGAGIGVNWFDNRQFVVKAFFAHRLGGNDAWQIPNASRIGINAVKYF